MIGFYCVQHGRQCIGQHRTNSLWKNCPSLSKNVLRQMGSWLKVNGEAIYSSIPWKYQNDTTNSNVWYVMFINKCMSHLLSSVIGIHSPKTCNQSTQLYSPGLKAQHKSPSVPQLLQLVQLWHFLPPVMVHWNGNLLVQVVGSSLIFRL